MRPGRLAEEDRDPCYDRRSNPRPRPGDFDVVFAGGGASITLQRQENTR